MSGTVQGAEIDLAAVNGATGWDGGVVHGAKLVAFTEAVMSSDEVAAARLRSELCEAVGDAAFVDCCAVIASFNVVDRVADATGIPLDDMLLEASRPVRDELDLARFASSVNTPHG